MSDQQSRPPSGQMQHLLYCDDAPAKASGGFPAILANILGRRAAGVPGAIGLLCARPVPPGATYAFGFGLISQKRASLPSPARAALLLFDYLTIQFRKLPARFNGLSTCIWIGNDWTSLVRGLWVAEKARARDVSVYVVDDIYEPRAGSVSGKVRLWITIRAFRRIGRRFAITPALCTELEQRTGLPWRQLPLPYHLPGAEGVRPSGAGEDAHTSPDDEHRFVFLGSLSPPVTAFLDQLIAAIRTENQRGGRFSLAIFSQNTSHYRDPRFQAALAAGDLAMHESLPDEEVERLTPASAVFIAPYSDRKQDERLVATSFPSKILKLLELRRHVVVVAPSYAAIAQTHGAWIPVVAPREALSDLAQLHRQGRGHRPWQSDDLMRLHSVDEYLRQTASPRPAHATAL